MQIKMKNGMNKCMVSNCENSNIEGNCFCEEHKEYESSFQEHLNWVSTVQMEIPIEEARKLGLNPCKEMNDEKGN